MKANGTAPTQEDRQATLAFMRDVKAGKADATPPSVQGAELEQAILVTLQVSVQAQGNIELLNTMYTSLGMAEGARGKKLHPLFAELLAEEEESTHARPGIPDFELSSCAPLPENARLSPSQAEGASPWLNEYIAFSRLWSPRAYDDFHEAVGLWLLSTIAARRVMLPHGGKRYTPLFIALTARTSLYSKSTTADIGLSVLSACGLDWLLAPDESTPQKFIQSLAGRLPSDYGSLSPSAAEQVRRQLALSGQRGWFYEEFGQHLSAMSRENGTMADFKGIIRRLDDCKEKYSRETISRGNETIYNPYVALLVGMTPADIRTYAKAGGAMWHDGFWARFSFVTPPHDDPKLDRFPRGYRIIPSTLALPLREWHDRLGMPSVTVNVTEEGGITWERGSLPESRASWSDEAYEAYYTYDIALKSLLVRPQYKHGDFDGNYVRFPEKALRIALLLSSLENQNRIEMCHWARAQEITERWRANLHYLYDQVNQAEETASEQMEDKIIRVVTRLGSPTAREISQHIRGLDTSSARAKSEELVRANVLEKFKAGKTEKYALIESVDTISLQQQEAPEAV